MVIVMVLAAFPSVRFPLGSLYDWVPSSSWCASFLPLSSPQSLFSKLRHPSYFLVFANALSLRFRVVGILLMIVNAVGRLSPYSGELPDF